MISDIYTSMLWFVSYISHMSLLSIGEKVQDAEKSKSKSNCEGEPHVTTDGPNDNQVRMMEVFC